MKKSNTNTSEIRSGLLIFITFCVLLGLLFMSGSIQLWKDNYDIHITYKYISGLQLNAPVHVAGFKVGKVTNIQFMGNDEPGVMVTASVDKNVVLKKDAEAYLNVAGFMGEMFVELFAGSKDAPKLEATDRIKGTDPIPLMELVKRGSQLLDKFEKIAATLDKMTDDMKELLGNNKGDLDLTIKNLNETSSNLKEMTYDLKRHPWKLLRKGKEEPIETDSRAEENKRRFLFF